jgi:hypothetical protein
VALLSSEIERMRVKYDNLQKTNDQLKMDFNQLTVDNDNIVKENAAIRNVYLKVIQDI